MMIREGRLGKDVDSDAVTYISSLKFDRNIVKYDVLGDIAHATMLGEKKIIPRSEAAKILSGLKGILKRAGKLSFEIKYEDVHMVIEAMLIRAIGDVGGKLHTARSRNDQIATDLRLWARDEVNGTSQEIITLNKTLLGISKKNLNTLMPGYTHLQHAQPTTLAHHMLAHSSALMRDCERFEDAYKRINLNPLGACALAGTSFQIDRKRTAELLGFDGLVENSMDAISSRDFLLETVSCLAILMADLSRIVEELILWSTSEFGFIELDNKFASTSSIMPQKKNPDVLEIMRAKTGRAFGNLVSCFIIMKSLPYSYNRDLQEISPLVFDSFDIAKSSLRLMNKILKSMKVNKAKMAGACKGTFIIATELADLLVRKNSIPFRTAHGIVGRAVAEAIKSGKAPKDIGPILDRVYGKPFGLSDKIKAISPFEAVKARKTLGSPSPDIVKKMIKSNEALVSAKEKNLRTREKKIEDSKNLLLKTADKLIKR